MRQYLMFFLVTAVVAGMVSCKRNPLKIDISHIKEEVKIVRFENELAKWNEQPTFDNLTSLYNQYRDFTELFTDQIIRIGTPENPESVSHLQSFLNDTMIASVYKLVNRQFSNFQPVEKELISAFKHFKHYFPERELPTIYTCVSGFNESAFVADEFIGISLDKYLGADAAYYPMLAIPRYKQRKMVPAMIPSDVMQVWAMGEFDPGNNTTTLLDNIVHEGKILYFMQAMMPAAHDSLLTGFTQDQLDWCRKNETQMWTYLIENELLYSNKQMDIVRYINDGPHTNGFPQESPARTGVWIGWQIVGKYMKRHPDVTLESLMKDYNYQEILMKSAYLP